jgi:hypothetical protein
MVDFVRRIQMKFSNGTHWRGLRETRAQGARYQFAAPRILSVCQHATHCTGIPEGIVVMLVETMLQSPALARAGEVQDALEEFAEKHGVSVSQLRIVNYMRILKRIIYQHIALDALREMLPRIRLPDGTTNGNILEY